TNRRCPPRTIAPPMTSISWLRGLRAVATLTLSSIITLAFAIPPASASNEADGPIPATPIRHDSDIWAPSQVASHSSDLAFGATGSAIRFAEDPYVSYRS